MLVNELKEYAGERKGIMSDDTASNRSSAGLQYYFGNLCMLSKIIKSSCVGKSDAGNNSLEALSLQENTIKNFEKMKEKIQKVFFFHFFQ